MRQEGQGETSEWLDLHLRQNQGTISLICNASRALSICGTPWSHAPVVLPFEKKA